MTTTKEKIPIVNCHTHTFLGAHVPPFLAKTLVVFPLYYLIHLRVLLGIYKKWLKISDQQRFKANSLYNSVKRQINNIRQSLAGNILIVACVSWLTLKTLTVTLGLLTLYGVISGSFIDLLKSYEDVLSWGWLQLPVSVTAPEICIALFTLLFIKRARKLVLLVLGSMWGAIRQLPGKNLKALLSRYVLIGRYTLHEQQSRVFNLLRNQYPSNTRFIVLPMDMEFMKAGKLKASASYEKQMEELLQIKSGSQGKYLEPFIFLDPRRIEKQEGFFDYSMDQNKNLKLNPCKVADYLNAGFSGFKIYPALGYYPFDEHLLPVWLYAATHGIPVMTHCIRGTIFYRGAKKKEWNSHPVFLESDGEGGTRPLSLPQKKNIDFSVNFTHPLNYLCLLHEPLLRKIVAGKPLLWKLFGYTTNHTPLKRDLSKLKICLAHFGGDDEWVKYLESDRYAFSQRLIRHRHHGIDFHTDNPGSISWHVLQQIWNHVDWYSIICSLILQYPNVYADISYILSNPRILPLLKETLNEGLNPHLRTRILYGTDFYVVRNHFSEKDMLAQMNAGLNETEFDLIARDNPVSYLSTTLRRPQRTRRAASSPPKRTALQKP